jgi:hypothetical protein
LLVQTYCSATRQKGQADEIRTCEDLQVLFFDERTNP